MALFFQTNIHIYGCVDLTTSFNFSFCVDYVFDGTTPPYAPSAKTNPLQLYGQTKRAGELALEQIDLAQSVILRVPVLFVYFSSYRTFNPEFGAGMVLRLRILTLLSISCWT